MKRRALHEIAAVVATGAAFAILVQIVPKLLVIVPCIAFWLTYVIVSAAREPSVLAEWGLRLDNLRESARLPALFVVASALGITAFRAIAGFRPLPGWAFVMFAVYPLWSLFQQLFIQSLIARNLRLLGVRRGATVAITALLFGAVHLPDVPLALLCVGAGAFWTACYLRSPNLIPLALAHGWIGTLTYAWLLERDPLAFPY
jgi:hypothetical protein